MGCARLTFARRRGRTVLTHSHVTAPMTMVRPFPLDGGRLVVQLITLGPGFCGGDRIAIDLTAEADTDVVVTTTAATRVLSMHSDRHAEQHVRITAAGGATIQYYPLVTIPFPESAFQQTVTVHATPGSRVGVLESWALGRTARDEYLRFRSLSNRTTLHVDDTLTYADAMELQPADTVLTGAGVLAGRRYLASGFWYGVTLSDPPQGDAGDGDLLLAFAQSRPGVVYLRALANEAPALDRAIRCAADRVADAWRYPPIALDRFRC